MTTTCLLCKTKTILITKTLLPAPVTACCCECPPLCGLILPGYFCWTGLEEDLAEVVDKLTKQTVVK